MTVKLTRDKNTLIPGGESIESSSDRGSMARYRMGLADYQAARDDGIISAGRMHEK